jgi:hypothetical protein
MSDSKSHKQMDQGLQTVDLKSQTSDPKSFACIDDELADVKKKLVTQAVQITFLKRACFQLAQVACDDPHFSVYVRAIAGTIDLKRAILTAVGLDQFGNPIQKKVSRQGAKSAKKKSVKEPQDSPHEEEER